MTKLRKSAEMETCTFNLPGICNHNPETTVLCHGPHPDKGMGKKGPDTWSAYGCSSCHDVMDGRRILAGTEKLDLVLSWFYAIRETQRRMIAKGLMPK